LSKIIDNIIRPTLNYGAPLITIDDVDGDILTLRHRDQFGALDEKYTEKTMAYIYELWGGPVELKTYLDEEKVTYSFDESGFDVL
jgi:stage V sporulation protein R